MGNNWKLPSDDGDLFDEDRVTIAEKDLTAALDLLESKRKWLSALLDEMGAEWFLSPRIDAEIKDIENYLKQFKP